MTDTTASLPANEGIDPEVPGRRRTTFHTLEVSEVRRLTADAIEVTFAVPSDLAGQYDYLPGQYVALRKELEDAEGNLVELRRSYSICAEPTPGAIHVAIKRDIGGIFSTWANESLVAGDTMDVMSPTGGFISKHKMNGMNDPVDIDVENEDTFVAVAAGSGITPVMAIARTVLAANKNVHFDLVYANKAAMDVMFLEELADLKDRYPARFALHHVLSREQRISPLLSGRIDAEKLNKLLGAVIRTDQVDEWFLCGPFELVQLVRDGLQGEVKSPVNARETILNAALRVRPDVPFACAGGVCGTCRAKVVEGAVDMDENYALEPDEIERGYVLTCQSRPTTERVLVDYDA